MFDITIPAWTEQANCASVDPDLFFPEAGESTAGAYLTCSRCDVIDQCRDYAKSNGEQYGIWAGKPPRARRAIAGEAA